MSYIDIIWQAAESWRENNGTSTARLLQQGWHVWLEDELFSDDRPIGDA